MKIAKKVLVVVMVIAMVAALSLCASAAGTYKIATVKDGDCIEAHVALKGGAGTTSDKFVVKYDPAVLEIADPEIDVAKGKDVEDMANVANNSFLGEANCETAGEVVYGYVFSNELSQGFLKPARGKTVNADPNDFEFIVIYFTVKNADAETTIQVLSEDGAVYDTAKIGPEKPADDPTPVEPEKPDEKPEEKPDEKPAEEGTKPANPGTGDKKTGDNMALAAAGAVIALAGVAFVISKKRK